MKNAQAKIDALLDALVEVAHDEIVAAGGVMTLSPEAFETATSRLRRLIELSNLNNAKQAKEGREPGAQSKVPELSNEDLVAELKATRKPDENFPRRGPRNGKRESVAPPEPRMCEVHKEERMAPTPLKDGQTLWTCPVCEKPEPEQVILNTKAMLRTQ